MAHSHGLEELPQMNLEDPSLLEQAAPGSGKENFLDWLFSDRPLTTKIAVLGPSSVGKTSLLASIHDQVNHVNCLSQVQLMAYPESSEQLKQHIRQMINQPWAKGIQSWPELMETMQPRIYRFQLVSTSTHLHFNLEFHDYPGHCLQQQPEQIIQLIQTSQIIFLVIDTPALLAEGGRWHEVINAGRQITDLIKRALQEFEGPKLLLLLPVKCERHLHYREYHPLLAAVQKEYAGLINFLGNFKREFAVAITPVQTFGGVRFVDCFEQEEKPVFLFEKHPDLLLYSPRDAEQPLIYSLSFILRGFFNNSRRFTKSEVKEHLEEVIGDLLQHRKQGAEGYKILQGARLL